jgi:hypothetical protein
MLARSTQTLESKSCVNELILEKIAIRIVLAWRIAAMEQ